MSITSVTIDEVFSKFVRVIPESQVNAEAKVTKEKSLGNSMIIIK